MVSHLHSSRKGQNFVAGTVECHNHVKQNLLINEHYFKNWSIHLKQWSGTTMWPRTITRKLTKLTLSYYTLISSMGSYKKQWTKHSWRMKNSWICVNGRILVVWVRPQHLYCWSIVLVQLATAMITNLFNYSRQNKLNRQQTHWIGEAVTKNDINS